MLWLRECPFDDQGLIRPRLTAANNVVLMCDECGTVWCQPDDIKDGGPFEVPSAPDWSVCGGDRLIPGTDQWADAGDVKRVGWDSLKWNDDIIDRAEGGQS
jgi:hypothetical protein